MTQNKHTFAPMGESLAKKDQQKKKAKAKQEKALKMKEHKENSSKKILDDMLAYIDENGNLSSTPPDPSKKVEINAEDIPLGVSRPVEEVEITRNGVITQFNESKGYGFITDLKSNESVFFHVNQLLQPVKERDKVVFETERTPKGLSAIKVKKQ